jgi:glycosyltransferase involved in cell wall biosynthesis
VIVATYNRCHLLAEALASVRSQTFQDWECLVADDESSDGTLPLLETAAAADGRIRALRGGHCGLPGRVRNRALRKATGSLIAFLDDDDIWLPGKIERQVRLIDAEPDVGLCFGRARRFGDARGVFPRVGTIRRRPRFETLWKRNFIPCSTVLARRGVLDSAGVFDETLPVAEDYDLWLRIARIAPIRFQSEILCLYRVHAARMSGDRAIEAEALESIYGRLASRWQLPVRFSRAGRRHVSRTRRRIAAGIAAS